MVVVATSVFATTIAPTLGAVLSNAMWATPILDIKRQRKLRTLGTINPMPYVVGMYCVYGWVLYGSLKHDGFIMWANFAAVGVLTYCNLSVVALSTAEIIRLEDSLSDTVVGTEKVSSAEGKMAELAAKQATLSYVEAGLWMAPLLWGLMSWLSWVVWNDSEQVINVVGWVAMVWQILFFWAPLSMLREVVRQGDSSSIFPPAVAANMANCGMWVVYGYTAIQDPMVWVPNFIGLVLQVVAISLVLRYPRTAANAAHKEVPHGGQADSGADSELLQPLTSNSDDNNCEYV